MQAVFDAVCHGLNRPDADARRLFHGRGHCFSGLEFINVDFLPPLVLITLYDDCEDERLQQLTDFCSRQPPVESVVVQRRYLPQAPTEIVYGGLPDFLNIVESGLIYQVRPGQHQNMGFFLDMAEGRNWVRFNCRNKQVLNLFAYTCGFSVAAMAGGAAKVVNLDMSRSALERGRENHRLNQLDLSKVRFLSHELFRSWGRIKKMGPYDCVIIDPPSFQKGSFVAGKDYPRVLRRLPELLADQAQVLVCLNDPSRGPEFLQQSMAEHFPECRFVKRLANPDSFPEREPERSLKVLLFEYNRE